MRIALQHSTVHISAGIAFVTIADDELLIAHSLTHEAPLRAGGESGAAASSQAGLGYLIYDFLGLHLSYCLAQSLVAVPRDILLNTLGVHILIMHNPDILQFEGGRLQVKQPFLNDLALDEVLFHYVGHLLRG